MIAANSICFSYGTHRILDHLTVSAENGTCVVLAGPNGSGKSTAISILAGVLRPDAGSISACGNVGYSPQGTTLFEDLTVGDNLRFFAKLAGCHVPKRLPFGVEARADLRVSRLSLGMKRQVSIACALLGNPENVLLDEPCASLDVDYREELEALVLRLKAEGRAVLYVGHDPNEFVRFCDRLVFLGQQPETFRREELAGVPDDQAHFCESYRALFRTINRK
ncbi:MAG: ATP-binding cassette domain-containing protein [Oscillospiraceae bacterium]|nr:ATP-binding cassette domain-containing protein [Oscillospiraceae bacterium]